MTFFEDQLEEGVFQICYCKNCNNTIWPHKEICHKCHNKTDWKTKKIVSPKQGRCVVFDGHYWHTSGQPTEQGDLRVIMNYNLQ